MQDLRAVLARQRQIDLLSYLLLGTLIATVSLLVYAMMNGLAVADVLVLNEPLVRLLAVALLASFIAYLADQQRRLRALIRERDQMLRRAHDEIAEAADRLAYAHHTAEMMVELPPREAVKRVLEDLAGHFGAEAAAIVTDNITVFTDDPDLENEASDAILPVAVECVTARKPVTCAVDEGGGQVIAVPLRAQGRLQYVCALWRRQGIFDVMQLEGLVLVARIMELGLEGMLKGAQDRSLQLSCRLGEDAPHPQTGTG